MEVNCSEMQELQFILFKNFASNLSQWQNEFKEGIACGGSNASMNVDLEDTEIEDGLWVENLGKDIYAFATPIIVVIGLLDNALSLTVFISKFMRRLSSTFYLATLSICHILILMTYVLWTWLDKGLKRWPGNKSINLLRFPAGCHIFLYISYTFRFASVWLIVAFAVDRYIATCQPEHRRTVCARPFARKVTLVTFLCAGLFSAYKPALSGVYNANKPSADSTLLCAGNPEYRQLNFLMDSIYVILITALPTVMISALSVPILRKLKPQHSAKAGARLVFKEHRIRLELTVILLAIAWCFILLSLPYFVTWCLQFFNTSLQSNVTIEADAPFFFESSSGKIAITRTLYYLNYVTNFFLYCLTGPHYRRQVRSFLMRRYRGFKDGLERRTEGTRT